MREASEAAFAITSTIAQFGTEDPSATGPTDDFEFPTALIEAQEAKLG